MIEYKLYRTYADLLDEPDDMTDEEKERLKRIKAIPEPIFKMTQQHIGNLRKAVMELEKMIDDYVDYLNGEVKGTRRRSKKS